MKRIALCALILLIALTCFGCSKEDTKVKNRNSSEVNTMASKDESSYNSLFGSHAVLKMKIVQNHPTGFSGTVEYKISDEDYRKYNELMGALKAEPDRPEEEIFQSLSESYGVPASELRQFVRDHMDDAIARDMGKSGNTPLESQMKEIAETVLKGILLENAKIDRKNLVVINSTNRRCVVQADVLDGKGAVHKVILKYVLNDGFSEAEIFQVKEDGRNIDLPFS